MTFRKKLDAIVKKNDSLLCIGLDPNLDSFPSSLVKKSFHQNVHAIFEFNKEIIDATYNLVCAYKPNSAFYEAYGIDSLMQLKKTINYLKKNYPEIPIILDAKRGDVPNTAQMYARAIYEYWGVDGATVYPHLGKDAISPFLQYKDKLTIMLVKTSNPDASVLQGFPRGKNPYFLQVAKEIKKWDFSNIGIFVGATYPRELSQIRKLFPNHIILSAGFGKQDADIKKAVLAGIDSKKAGIMFNASRSILYASSGKDFAEKAREEAMKLRDVINGYRYGSKN